MSAPALLAITGGPGAGKTAVLEVVRLHFGAEVVVESAAEAYRIDERIAAAWSGHPRRIFVESCDAFTDKLALVMRLLRVEIDALTGNSAPASSNAGESAGAAQP